MNSIGVGKIVFTLLNEDSRLTALVGNKIYPVIVEKDTSYPFIVYKRSNITSNYTKDLHLTDDVSIDIVCVTATYAEGIEIAGIIKDTLEDKRIKDFEVERIVLDSASEDYVDNAFIQSLGFTITIKP